MVLAPADRNAGKRVTAGSGELAVGLSSCSTAQPKQLACRSFLPTKSRPTEKGKATLAHNRLLNSATCWRPSKSAAEIPSYVAQQSVQAKRTSSAYHIGSCFFKERCKWSANDLRCGLNNISYPAAHRCRMQQTLIY